MDKTHSLPTSDLLTDRIEHALQQVRETDRVLNEQVIPHMPIAKRSFSIELVRKIGRGQIFAETIMRDLEALVLQIEREAENGTDHGWHADENHIEGGWPMTYLNEQADALLTGADSLRELRDSIAAVLDLRRAVSIANHLSDKF